MKNQLLTIITLLSFCLQGYSQCIGQVTLQSNKDEYNLGETITLEAIISSSSFTRIYEWYISDGTLISATNINGIGLDIDSLVSDLSFYVIVKDISSTCPDIQSPLVSIDVVDSNNQQFRVTATANQTEPQIGEEITLSAQVQNGSGDYSYTWYAASTPNFRIKKTSIGSGASITFTQTAIDDYYVHVTDNETGIEGYSNYVFNKEVIASNSPSPTSLSTSVFPTLTFGLLNIESSGAYDITVYNATGEVVFSQQGQNSEQLDLSQLPNGSYFVQIRQNNETNTEKIIIQK